MKHIVKIISIKHVTHDVKSFTVEKPGEYTFTPGQATDVAINKPGWEQEVRPFTFTGLTTEIHLEFTIKGYSDHDGVTNQLHQLQTGDELIVEEPWGAIQYKGAGYFIAGGSGITPFIAILRSLNKENTITGNTLFFSNKTTEDIIYKDELDTILGSNAVHILSKENNPLYEYGFINEEFIKAHVTDFTKQFYICGPDKMITDVTAILVKLGADVESVIFEK